MTPRCRTSRLQPPDDRAPTSIGDPAVRTPERRAGMPITNHLAAVNVRADPADRPSAVAGLEPQLGLVRRNVGSSLKAGRLSLGCAGAAVVVDVRSARSA